jgi:hypothetical protein
MSSKKASNDPGYCPIKEQNSSLGTRTGDVFDCTHTLIFILGKTAAVGALHLKFNWLRSVGRTMHCCAVKQQEVKGGCRKLHSVGRRHYLDVPIKEDKRGMTEGRNYSVALAGKMKDRLLKVIHLDENIILKWIINSI